jgi:predicted ribosomally synthesized peptide with nif11-like leader
MSIESAKQFLEKLKADEEFRNKVTAKETSEAKMEFATAEGFSFTEEEYKQAVDAVGVPVSDDDLDNAAGGCGFHLSGCKIHL